MEVEHSGNFLDCSGNWLVALVAENSHVVHLAMEGRAQNTRVSISAITSYAKAGNTNNASKKQNGRLGAGQGEVSI